jgi:general secretion pathway protein G
MSRYLQGFICCVFFTACLAVHAGAQDNKPDPKLQAVLDQMTTAYKNINALHLKATMKIAGIVPEDIVDGMPENAELRLQRPNKIWLDNTQRHGQIAKRHLIVSDGENLWRWETGMNAFTITKAPANFNNMANMSDAFPEFELLFDGINPFEDLIEEGAMKLGMPIKLNDIDVDVLEAMVPTPPFYTTVKIMVGQKDHLVRGLTVYGKGKNPKTGGDIDFKCEFVYSVINAAPTFTPADFVFAPPPGIAEPGSSKPTESIRPLEQSIRLAKKQIAIFMEAVEAYIFDTARCPTTAEGLNALVFNTTKSDSWAGPYFKPPVTSDPWGKPYIYRNPGQHGDFDIHSAGPDGIDGNDDDVCSWK